MTLTEPADAPSGARERKKRETARAIEVAAVELALAQGLGEVTVEAISAAADVTSRTFFNYYASKEDAVLGNSRAFPPPSLASVAWRPGSSVRSQVLAAILGHLESFDMGSPAFVEKKRLLISANPHLLAKDFQSLGAIEAEFAREVERLLGEEARGGPSPLTADDIVPGDQAWAIVFSIGSTLRMAMHTWSSVSASTGVDRTLAEHISYADRLLLGVASPG
ncbi:TetR/AcrR family transcriptional regulator [Herbiconiux moechotypicola]|uniref:TetR/AcrR family transcriptional regulator n=1 Tax=Herbiconiux moechotypicola TaxID=637393 RepID=A0ABP5Q3N1_9MICO|nr:helix-turn-helix domain-containing protein [Herbiconiux moechotypicola]MCS5728250.1 TetR/AcrR family transcriptional regulator [Herbiconiux moechotypicola]